MIKNKLDLIFKSYDVRGIYQDEITNEIASKIGYAFSEFVKDDEILIGHDGRLSNLEMLNSVVSGITANNKKCIYVGLVPTDVVYSLSGLLQKPGIIITASHNPKEYTGLKFCNSGAEPIGETSGLKVIKNRTLEIEDIEILENQIKKSDVLSLYFEHLQKLINPNSISKNKRFGVDGGNGAIGSVFASLSKIYSFNYESLYLEIDGNFPNHPADPSDEKNLEDLKRIVLSKNLDFGVAFDGDADRAVFIDDRGRLITGSMMTALISENLSEEKENLKVVHNVNVSPYALSYLKNKNINLFECKVGHSNIKALMREIDADFGGEHSAHFYYKENFYADSAILTLLTFMRILSEKNMKVSEIIDMYDFPPSSGEVNFKVQSVNASLEKIKVEFGDNFDDLDGLSYKTEDYWFNVRGSNTEPKLRINIEAKSEKLLKELTKKIVETI
ncbi:MAG: phosphomannomutase/phosphoglucomutase [Candidatus Actinomarina sp.]|nr:phosphomannomutase/phosphoglucomutase [Actinomycetota bacterium]